MKKKNPLARTDDHRAREQGWKSLNLWHITCHQSIFRTKGKKILQTEETFKCYHKQDDRGSRYILQSTSQWERNLCGAKKWRYTRVPYNEDPRREQWVNEISIDDRKRYREKWLRAWYEGYIHKRAFFLLTWQPGDLSRSTTTVRMDSHWRKDNLLSNLPPTLPYREVTAVPVVRSTYRELRQRTGHHPEWTSAAPEAVDSRLKVQRSPSKENL